MRSYALRARVLPRLGRLPPGQALDDWLNGVYFHDDEDRLERVEALRPFGYHHFLALGAGRDLSRVYLAFSEQVVPSGDGRVGCLSAGSLRLAPLEQR